MKDNVAYKDKCKKCGSMYMKGETIELLKDMDKRCSLCKNLIIEKNEIKNEL